MLSLYVSDRSFTKSHFSQFTSLQVLGLTEILNEMPAVQRLHFMSLNFFSHFTTLQVLELTETHAVRP